MAAIKFLNVVAKDGYTAKQRYDAISPKEEGTFYKVGDECYLKDQLITAETAAQIMLADPSGLFTAEDVEAALAEVFGVAVDKTIWVHDDSAGQSDYAKVYHIYQGTNDYVADRVDGLTNPTLKGTINIPKDMVVQDGEIVDITWDAVNSKLMDGDVDVTSLIVPSGQTPSEDFAGKYIKLTLQNVTDPLYIAVNDLVDVYTGGTTSEATITVDEHNVIKAEIVKVTATKIIYSEATEAVYTQVEVGDTFDPAVDYYTTDGSTYTKDATVDATNFDTKVTAGLYTLTTPASAEKNIKTKVDEVETKVDNLTVYVGTIPSGATATDVVGYIDEKTGAGVSALNSEATIATKSSDVVTIKGGIVEVEGLIANNDAKSTVVEGYKNPADDEFYEESGFVTKITPETTKSYKDLTDNTVYNWTGKAYVEVKPDIVLEEVAITGAAEDVSIADAGGLLTATNVEDAIQELATTTSWQDV